MEPRRRRNDPLGFGLRSIPEPLQRLWLIQKGNPYFEDDVRHERKALGIPPEGFKDTQRYIDWVATRWARHGHGGQLPVFLIVGGIPLRHREAMTRHFAKGMAWPPQGVPAKCCESDPLYMAATRLAIRYGIDKAAAEPGFGGMEEDIAAHLLVAGPWPLHKSRRGHKAIYETDIVVDPQAGKRLRERYLKTELGLESRAGEGGMLWLWYEWWSRSRETMDVVDIQIWTEERFGEENEYDQSSIKYGIEQVETLMRPVGN